MRQSIRDKILILQTKQNNGRNISKLLKYETKLPIDRIDNCS